MDTKQRKKFTILFEQMIDVMTDPEHFDRKVFVGILTEISLLFRLSKGVTEFYTSMSNERKGVGEVLIDYDNGHGDVAVLRRRIIGKSGAVIIGTLYMARDTQPLDEEEREKLDLVQRALLSFISRNRMQDTIERLGFSDESGYPNFRAFRRFAERLNEAGRLGGYVGIYLNLRHFALINQAVGRLQGDEVMRSYVNLLEMAAGEDGIIARLGGDNFVMLVQGELLDQVTEILNSAIVYYGEKGDKKVRVSASAGIFIVPEGFVMNDPGELMERMISAVTVARRDEQGSIVYYNSEMQVLRDRMMWVQHLFPLAIENREFKVFYQPKVDVTSGCIVGAEALCRWFRDGKIVPPMEFIPVLEQSMDICTLDFYMLDQTCRDIVRWIAEGRQVVRISVNLSRKHLTDVDLLEHIMEIIERNHVPHQYIEIELTETTTDVEFKDLKRVVSGLQREGVYTSVDDFGMGYSSLNLIREVPWNVLKIDRCFLPTDEDAEDSVTNMMFKHVVAMARDMGLECITEGVETAGQVELLRRNQCHIAQGFFFDRPLPVAEFETRLDQHQYALEPKDA
ncbi:MAG: EAL domain-containing protein [Butyrivibrio sp.]|nr:EAL domain-containing protein [Butyrivibrio sp.]